jgi:neurofibromin 1
MSSYNANVFKGSSVKPRDSYPDEQFTLLKPVEPTNSSDIICSVLTFLDASPLTLYAAPSATVYAGGSTTGEAWDRFIEKTLNNFVSWLVSDDARIRYMANSVTRKLLVNGTRSLKLRRERIEGGTFDPHTYKHNFWRSS